MDTEFITHQHSQGIDIQLYPVLRLVIFFILGIIVGYSCSTITSFYFWGILLVASFFLCLFLRKKKLWQSVSVFILVAIVGGWYSSFCYLRLSKTLPKGKHFYKAVMLTEPTRHGKVMMADMLIFLQRKTLKVKTSILCDTISKHYSTLHLADGVLLYGELEAPTNFANSSFDYAEYLKLHGYSAELFIFDSQWQKEKISLSSMSYIDRTLLFAKVLRTHCVSMLQRVIHDNQMAIVSAMMLGDRSYINKSLKEDYSVTGATHVMALSGLHLSIIYSILWFLFSGLGNISLFFRLKEIKHFLLIITIWAYVFLVGFSPSIVRSALMLSIYSFIALLGRKKVSINILSVVAFCILLYDPFVLFDVSFQLSFAAIVSILLYYPQINKLLNKGFLCKYKIFERIFQMFTITLSAQIGTAPLIAFYFSKLPTYFFLSSFIAIPCTTIILYAGVFFFIFIWLTPLQWLLGQVLYLTTTFLNNSLHWLSSLPMASIFVGNITAYQVVLVYFMLIILLLVISFFNREIRFR